MANKSYKKFKTTSQNDDYDNEDDYDDRKTGKKKMSPRRRPVRNWKHAAVHSEGLDDQD